MHGQPHIRSQKSVFERGTALRARSVVNLACGHAESTSATLADCMHPSVYEAQLES